MPTFDEHLVWLTNSLRDLLRDRIMAAALLSKDRKVFGVERWANPEGHKKEEPFRWIHVMAEDEGGCQIYLRLKPTAGAPASRWMRAKRIPLLHLEEEDLLSLKKLVWYPNDPECPLVVLARCAK